MSAQLDKDPSSRHEALPQYYRSILRDFRKISEFYIGFNLWAVGILGAELLGFFAFLPFLSTTVVIALSLSTLFLTGFSYAVLLFYFQTKKPEQFLFLKEQFIHACSPLLSSPLSLAEALSNLAAHLNTAELSFRLFFKPLSRFAIQSFVEDTAKMKHLLLRAAIEEHLKQIRITPTDLEAHASLAGNYISLSQLYRTQGAEEKFQKTAKLAIEEFRILCHYAPNDPWTHEQLADGYRSLGLPAEELRETEILLKLRPSDKEILLRLGILYFQQGENAKGLQVYEELKRGNFAKADELIEFYGIFSQKNS